MSDNRFPQAVVPQSCRHAAALTSDELDLDGQSWNGAETAMGPTAQVSSHWQVPGDWHLASSSDPAQLDLCQYWYNAGWQQGFSQGASQCYCPYQAMPGAQALPAASPQFPLHTNPRVHMNPKLLTPPESGLQSPPPTDIRWGNTGGLQAPSGTGSDHNHRDLAKCRCGYDELLMEAFRSNPGKPLSMGDIHQWFKTNTHITTSKKESTWRTGIRRNLNTCKTSAKYHSEGERWMLRETP
ncbi:hypothetical protein EDB81DRAFT_807106 [Dactylonectria macrodidyma]|uniref:Fork-head domain-containing protein n=1 Tax=Dactylonectria macrodidyma TaxID=307937 RepID=A0A9P9ITL3_9HYPO|nr:hypothetical protein EDB81DRAFT_807106 [Dactylonectria macrodidyma]